MALSQLETGSEASVISAKKKSSNRSRKDEAVTDTETPLRPSEEKKKRKRVEDEPELEVDLSLPEPLSKKAARKAKKQKTVEENAQIKQNAEKRQEENLKEHGGKEQEEIKLTEAEEAPEESRKRSKWGIWIGNLPWIAKKNEVCDFITENAGLKRGAITRINMPAPNPSQAKRGNVELHNKGFAYIDFDTEESQKNALALTETQWPGNTRRVLIKNATSFEGRPQTHGSGKGLDADKANTEKPPSKRVFVGNLTFETTKDDLTEHYSQCGAVADIHVATFEDSGKCKGYAWVTFEQDDAAESAVRGWFWKDFGPKDDDNESKNEEGRPHKKPKRRKWFVSRLNGRELRVEYAEGADVRYKKRFGKDGASRKQQPQDVEPVEEVTNNGASDQRTNGRSSAHNRRKEARKAERDQLRPKFLKLSKPALDSKKASGAIVESIGKKITFGD